MINVSACTCIQFYLNMSVMFLRVIGQLISRSTNYLFIWKVVGLIFIWFVNYYILKRQNMRILLCIKVIGRSQWPRGLRRRSTAARLLRSWVRIPPRAWMFVCSECCVLSGRGLCDGLIIRSEESYRLWRVVVCEQETSQARRLKPARGL